MTHQTSPETAKAFGIFRSRDAQTHADTQAHADAQYEAYRKPLVEAQERNRQANLKAQEERERARQEEVQREVRERRDAEQKRAEAELKESLRAAYLGANPAATDADFDRAYPRLREEHMDRRALQVGSALEQELALARQRHKSF